MFENRVTRFALAVVVVLGVAGTATVAAAGPAGATATVATSFTIKVNGVKGPLATTASPTSTVRVAGLPARATGTVEIDQAGSPWCTMTLPVHSCTTASLAPGSYPTITGTYAGDATYLGSTSGNTVDLTVLAPGGSTITCAKMSGYVTAKIAFTFCQVAQKGGYLAGSDSLTGGALTWTASATVTTFSGSATSPGQGACATGRTEEDFTGTVTADTSTLVAVGGTVTYRYCQGATGIVKLVPGTKATF
jgi:hypothetical protein